MSMATYSDLDKDARYTVAGYSGVAFYIHGPATTWEEIEGVDYDPIGGEHHVYGTGEFEEVEDPDSAVVIMVGDDRKHTVAVADLTKIGDGDYCRVCGQVGCTHDGR